MADLNIVINNDVIKNIAKNRMDGVDMLRRRVNRFYEENKNKITLDFLIKGEKKMSINDIYKTSIKLLSDLDIDILPYYTKALRNEYSGEDELKTTYEYITYTWDNKWATAQKSINDMLLEVDKYFKITRPDAKKMSGLIVVIVIVIIIIIIIIAIIVIVNKTKKEGYYVGKRYLSNNMDFKVNRDMGPKIRYSAHDRIHGDTSYINLDNRVYTRSNTKYLW